MRLPIPAISALLLSLPAVLGKVFPVPLKIVLATDWSDGFVDVWDPENKEINIKTLTHTIPVDGQDIWDIHEYTIAESKEEKQDLFRVRRTAWGTSRRVCEIFVTKDPEVPVVHILLDGGGNKEDIRVNGHNDAVQVVCRDE